MTYNRELTKFKGLSEKDTTELQKKEGFNELPSSEPKTLWAIIWEVLKEPMFILLATCASLYLVLGDVQEGVILMSWVLIVVGITFYQERKTERALDAIRDLSSPRALVIRDGEAKRIAGREVVRGDIIMLQEGDRVPADAKILYNISLLINESLLTGESAPVRKAVWKGENAAVHAGGEDSPFVYSGTMVVQGQAVAEVIAIGVATEMGKIGKSLENVEEEKTLLQTEIRQLVRRVFVIGLVTFVVSVVTYGILRGHWLEGVLAGLGLAMGMLPEEFPVVLTVFMALGAWRMSRKNVLARKVASIETLGSATVLCSDKTGTITQNHMTVTQLFAASKFWDINKNKSLDLPEDFHELIEYALLAGQTDPFDPMEKAILDIGNIKLAGTEHIHSDWTLVQEYPLSKEMLSMSRVFSKSNSKQQAVAAKGAPEAIMDLCHMDEQQKAALHEVVTTMANDGLRILGVAKADAPHENITEGRLISRTQHDFNFHFVGLIGLSDPIRQEVPQAIDECQQAGIRVIMITGDYAATAQSIAEQIGLDNSNRVITGSELDKMTDIELREAVKTVNVFSRVVPEQKLRLVTALKNNGEVVAMTGDGVNDAPALKAAHIGIAMGGKGTDVARETAGLVLLDDNFASIVTAIKMGRRIFSNLQKALIYIFAIHIPFIVLSVVPMMTSFLPLMLMPIHIAFLELIIDPACSVVFEAEPAERDIMQHPPKRLGEPFFSWRKMQIGIFQGLGVSIATLGVYGLGLYWHYDEKTMRAMTFVTLLIANLSLILSNRSLHKTALETLWTIKNPTVSWLIAGILAFTFAIIYIPFLNHIFKIDTLTFSNLAISILMGILSISWFEILKAQKVR